MLSLQYEQLGRSNLKPETVLIRSGAISYLGNGTGLARTLGGRERQKSRSMNRLRPVSFRALKKRSWTRAQHERGIRQGHTCRGIMMADCSVEIKCNLVFKKCLKCCLSKGWLYSDQNLKISVHVYADFGSICQSDSYIVLIVIFHQEIIELTKWNDKKKKRTIIDHECILNFFSPQFFPSKKCIHVTRIVGLVY